MKSEEEEWKSPKKTVKASNRSMDVDEAQVERGQFAELWNDYEYEEFQYNPCEAIFHRP